MFFTSDSDGKDVWPVSTGAPYHVPSSTKRRDSRLRGRVVKHVPVGTAGAVERKDATLSSPPVPRDQAEWSAAMVLGCVRA
jgi:hypothetical protein